VEKHIGVGVEKKTTGKLIGYARVSTEDQELRLQVDALEKAGCWNIWKEKRSATRGPRPQLEMALKDLRPGDTLMVWKLDRLIRNARDAYKILDRIEEAGATVVSLTEPHLNVHTPIGEFMLGITALLAQLEVRQTSQRTAAGIKAIQDRGLRYGAPPKLSDTKAAKLVALRKADPKLWTHAKLSKRFDVSHATVINYLNRAKSRRKRK
jgi:DNA invertase Pin-like site-specific DNA recombinase